MSDIKRLGLSGSADYATAVKRYGGGGDNNRPELGRWCFIFNNSTTDIPLFEHTVKLSQHYRQPYLRLDVCGTSQLQ